MILTELTQFTDIGLYILRLAVGLIFIYHAVPKLRNSKEMASMMGSEKAKLMILALGLVELLSAFGLILGIYIALSAVLLGIVMIGAILLKITKWHSPFSAADKTGWEFDLILLAANIAILATGGGSIALL
jgi:uncharacterized membrane protein YphA (DoxX/SURF4 family)